MAKENVMFDETNLTVENEILISEWEQSMKKLENEIARLRDENNKLEETVKWMHDLIWQLVKEREEAGIEFEL